MNIGIRVDSSIKIGFGHIFRCLNLAKELIKYNYKVTFYCQNLEGNLNEHLRKFFKVIEVSADVSSLLNTLIADTELLIIDSYDIDDLYEEEVIKEANCKLVVIDDINRQHNCNLLIDQNYTANEMSYPDLKSCQKLTGLSYAMLGDNFEKLHQELKVRNEFKKVLVFFGGGDISAESLKVLKAIENIKQCDKQFLIISKSLFNKKNKYTHLSNVEVLDFVEDMAKLMAESDIMFGTSGTTNWERFCTGLPAIVVSVADNQVPNAVKLSEDNLIKYLGSGFDTTSYDWENVIKKLDTESELYKSNSVEISKLVDGKGCSRIASKIEELLQEEN
ncbi:UDP-2,4-diacetamido-2,4,6-trideoxy-beta-L-altropyranose hydrolase [Acetoanaerobium sticklandii]|uniref:UDP-2,4-diacetamido-2,4, 6-trideoxy-beta-L-altropyranose hydrolase n=1 Tax=Acetoanaerobium sticklandii TaxID=1511 RepID=UPI003A9438B0